MNNDNLLIITAIVFAVALIALIVSIIIRNRSHKAEANIEPGTKPKTSPITPIGQPVNNQINSIYQGHSQITPISPNNNPAPAGNLSPLMPNTPANSMNTPPITSEGFKAEPETNTPDIMAQPITPNIATNNSPAPINTPIQSTPVVPPTSESLSNLNTNPIANPTESSLTDNQVQEETINTVNLDAPNTTGGTDLNTGNNTAPTTTEVDLSRNPWEEPISQNSQFETVGSPETAETPSVATTNQPINTDSANSLPELNQAANPVNNTNANNTTTTSELPLNTTTPAINNNPIEIPTIPTTPDINSNVNLSSIKPETTIPAEQPDAIPSSSEVNPLSNQPVAQPASNNTGMPNLDLPPLGNQTTNAATPVPTAPVNPGGMVSNNGMPQQPTSGTTDQQNSNFNLPPL